jgi:hypothetical protein
VTNVLRQSVMLAQERGPDLELVVEGDEHYATYETREGYTVLHDPDRGFFCYASLDAAGAFVSTGVPASAPPPAGLRPHAREAPEIRQEKTARSVARRAPPT